MFIEENKMISTQKLHEILEIKKSHTEWFEEIVKQYNLSESDYKINFIYSPDSECGIFDNYMTVKAIKDYLFNLHTIHARELYDLIIIEEYKLEEKKNK